MPRPLCGPGMWGLDVLGRLVGERPFERPWMARYIDLEMTVDARRTREVLGWAPRPRLDVLRRLPFLLENRRTDAIEWMRANRAAMKQGHLETNLRIHRLLKKHASEIAAEFTEVLMSPDGRERFASYQDISQDEHRWNHTLVLRHLMNAVRTRERGILVSYCRDLAERRFQQGFEAREVCDALRELNRIVFKHLRRDPEGEGLRQDIKNHVTMTLTWGCDEAQQVFEHLEVRCRNSHLPPRLPGAGRGPRATGCLGFRWRGGGGTVVGTRTTPADPSGGGRGPPGWGAGGAVFGGPWRTKDDASRCGAPFRAWASGPGSTASPGRRASRDGSATTGSG